MDDRVVDLVEEGVDVAIRLGSVLPPNVVARQIASSPRVLVASPEYIERNPKVRKPEDLVKHEYLRFAGVSFGAQMEFSRGTEKVVVPVGGRYRVNSSLALRQCFLAGAGVGTAGAWLVQDLIDTGALVRLLPKWQMASQPVHLVYPSRRYQPLRTRTLLQFLAARLSLLPGLYGPVA